MSEPTIKEDEIDPRLCPRCGATDAHDLTRTESNPNDWHCRPCGYRWPQAVFCAPGSPSRYVDVLPLLHRVADDVRAWNRRADPWISVAERLPAAGCKVLVCYTDGDVSINWRVNGRWKTHHAPVLWMPLPAAPKGGDA